MPRDELSGLALAVILIAVAGCVDAIGFLKLGHLFVSFMSGDSTQLAVAGGERKWHKAAAAGGVVAAFLAGVIGGRLLARWSRGWCRPAVLYSESGLLVLSAALAPSTVRVVVPMVLAMGVQNAALQRVGAARMALTYVTGTLVGLGERLADALGGCESEQRWAWIPYLLLWLGLVAGAAGGALAYRALGVQALTIPAAVVFVLALLYTLMLRRGDARAANAKVPGADSNRHNRTITTQLGGST